MEISKHLREVLKFLGPEYTAKIIDGEDCVYRDLENGYDIEISGCSRKPYHMVIFVWELSNLQISEQSEPMHTLPELRKKLDELCCKWLDSTARKTVDHKAIQAKIIEHIKKSGFASYPELQDIFIDAGFDYKGDLDIISSVNENVIFWSGWNKEALDIINEMKSNGTVEQRPLSQLEVLISGGMLRLPLVTGNYQYKTPHWLPIAFVVRERDRDVK